MKSINSEQYNSNFGLKLKIPPPIYMFLFVGVMWVVGNQIESARITHEPWNKLSFVILILSFMPASGAFRLFSRYQTTPDPRHPEKASKLVTSGIYRFTRNPMYLGLFLILVAWAVFLGNLLVMFFPFLFIWVLTELQIKPEEAALQKKFGQEYVYYKQSVRRWL